MKKNNIKIKKDGTHTYRNENIWMHSVERPVSDNEGLEIAKAFALVIGMGVLALVFIFLIGGC